MENILLKKAKKYHVKQKLDLKSVTYNGKNGFRVDKSGIPLIESEFAKKLTTKKEDIETGEDQKGE